MDGIVNRKCKLINLLLPILSLGGVVGVANAEEQTSLEWLFDVDAGYQQQTIDKSTAELTSVIFAPSLELGNWDLSLNVPWYEKQGEFYINGTRPRLITRCERITNLKPARQKLLIELGKLTQKQLDRCEIVLETLTQLNAKHSGIGDITGFARYRFPLGDDSGWGASLGAGFKSDTGDSETGIGSGTQDGLFELGLFLQRDKFSFSVNLGYDAVSGDESIADIYQTQNYAYTSLNLSRSITSWLTLGASFSGQQAYVANGEDTKIVTEYIDLSFVENLNIHLYASQYSGDSLLPDKELGANITYSF
jgi:hypothetical protein